MSFSLENVVSVYFYLPHTICVSVSMPHSMQVPWAALCTVKPEPGLVIPVLSFLCFCTVGNTSPIEKVGLFNIHIFPDLSLPSSSISDSGSTRPLSSISSSSYARTGLLVSDAFCFLWLYCPLWALLQLYPYCPPTNHHLHHLSLSMSTESSSAPLTTFGSVSLPCLQCIAQILCS